MKTNSIILTVLILAMLIINMACNGGSTEIGNARSDITGSINDNDTAVYDAQVQLVEECYIPGGDTTGKVFSTRTDCSGNYSFSSIPRGSYYLTAKKTAKRLLRGPVEIDKNEEVIASATLLPSANVTLAIAGNDSINVVYIKGMTEFYEVSGDSMKLDAVPQGDVTIIGYKKTGEIPNKLSDDNSRKITFNIAYSDHVVASFTNTAPRITTPVESMSHVIRPDTATYFLDLDVADAENDEVWFKLTSAPAGMVIDSITGMVFWEPDSAVSSGYYGASVVVTDARGASSKLSWNIVIADNVFVITDTSLQTEGKLGSTYIVIAGVNKDTNVSAFRFAWGDGDTTSWQKENEAAHAWTKQGDYKVSYQVQYVNNGNFSGWMGSAVLRISEDKDVTPPVMMLKGGDTIFIGTDYPFEDPGCSAYDEGDSSIVEVMVGGNLDTSRNGCYHLSYTAFDSKGNVAAITRVVIVDHIGRSDVFPPEIKLLGSDTIIVPDSMTVESFMKTWEEPGYSAFDREENVDVTSRVVVSTIATATNEYCIKYVVKDSSGNQAISIRIIMKINQSGSPEIIPDKDSTGMLSKYNAPANDSLPDISDMFTVLEIDGKIDSVAGFASLSVHWDENTDSLTAFYGILQDRPDTIDFLESGVLTQSFGTSSPAMTISGCGIVGIDGKYFVTMAGGKFIWVEQTGAYALIWSK